VELPSLDLLGRDLLVVPLWHLYHLEHHLYPQVPHHNWPELGRRLDPYFASIGLRPLRLFF
jgi:beta-carotene hydroxylase